MAPGITVTDTDGSVREWNTLRDVELLVAALKAAIGEGAVAIVMVAKNGAPHSRHHVSWTGSCLEVRGLLAQGTDVIEKRVNGNNPHPDDVRAQASAAMNSGGAMGGTFVASSLPGGAFSSSHDGAGGGAGGSR